MMALFIVAVTSGYSFVGFGVHGGVDLITIDKIEAEAFNVNIGVGEYSYSLTREEISNPIVFGAQFYLDMPVLPIGFEADVTYAYAKYKWVGDDELTGNGVPNINIGLLGYETEDGEYSEEFTYSRLSVDVTAKYYFLNLPPVINTASFYIGGGAGAHFITPLVSEDFFKKEFENADTSGDNIELDVDDLVKSEVVFGGHIVAGVKIKPPAIPLAFNIDYKHTFTPENDYKDETNNFGTVKVSASFYM